MTQTCKKRKQIIFTRYYTATIHWCSSVEAKDTEYAQIAVQMEVSGSRTVVRFAQRWTTVGHAPLWTHRDYCLLEALRGFCSCSPHATWGEY